MPGVSNTQFGPPPLQNSLMRQLADQSGVPFQLRDIPRADLDVSWAQWFNALWARETISPRMVSTTQANLASLANFLTAYDVVVAPNFNPATGNVTLGSGPFLVSVTDFNHVLQWTGTGWQWGPGEPGSGMLVLFEVDPTGVGWHLYDGTANVPYLKSDGTLGTVTLPDLTSVVGNAAFLDAGSPNGGPNAAVAPGLSGSTAAAATGLTVGNDNGLGTTFTQGSGLAVTVASHPHNHPVTDPTHSHAFGTLAADATGKPRNLVRRPWFRQ